MGSFTSVKQTKELRKSHENSGKLHFQNSVIKMTSREFCREVDLGNKVKELWSRLKTNQLGNLVSCRNGNEFQVHELDVDDS